MLVELCIDNYSTLDGLIDNVMGLVKALTNDSKEIIWVLFNNPKKQWICHNHLCTHVIYSTWAPIKPISRKIQIGSNAFYTIIRTQFHIQLALAHTIHHTQGLTLYYLAFHLTYVYKHELT
jgi:hypothetical protein